MLRLTGGAHAGRVIKTARGVRPTSARARAGLFSSLGDLAGFGALDLYAGSGALGLEALSRGAVSVTFVERERARARVIEANLGALGLRGRVLVSPVARALSHLGAHDLVLADPPYGDTDLRRELRLLYNCVKSDGVFVLECSSRDEAPAFAGFERVRRLKYGETVFLLYRRLSGDV